MGKFNKNSSSKHKNVVDHQDKQHQEHLISILLEVKVNQVIKQPEKTTISNRNFSKNSTILLLPVRHSSFSSFQNSFDFLEGDYVTLESIVISTTPVHAIWFKNNIPLQDNPDCRLIQEDKRFQLIIKV